jgi:hypothetical protein
MTAISSTNPAAMLARMQQARTQTDSRIAAATKAGTISGADQTALESALDSIDSSISGASATRSSGGTTGKKGALFRGDGSDPKLIETNTSTEYWQKGASLLTTDPLGRMDVDLPPNSRAYMIAGTQHGGRAGATTDAGPNVNPRNPHNPMPAVRAIGLSRKAASIRRSIGARA